MSIVARAYSLFVVGFVGWAIFAALRDHATIPSTDDTRILIDMFRLPFWEWVFSSQNGHRVPGTLLLFAADYRWFDGQNHLMIVASLVTLVLALAVLFWAARMRAGLATPLSQMLFAAAVFVLFFVASSYNLLRGVCHANAAVVLFAFASIGCLVRYREAGQTRFLIACLVAGLLSTVSMGQGVAIWPALVLLAVVMRLPRAPLAAIVLVAVAIGGVAAATMADATNQFAQKPAAEVVFLHPLTLLRFVATLLGGVVATMARELGLVVGPIGQQNGVAGTAGLILCAAHARWIRSHPRRANPQDWLAVGVMAFAAAVAAGVGATRLFTLGFDEAHMARFFDWSGLFWAGSLLSLSAFGQRATRSTAWFVRCASLVLVVTAVLTSSLATMRALRLGKLDDAADAALAVVLEVAGPADLELIHRGDPGDWHSLLERLKREQKSLYADSRASWLGEAPALRLDEAASCRGRIKRRSAKDDDPDAEWRISGWAWDDTANAPPSSVVLADPLGNLRGLANVRPERSWGRHDRARWRGRVASSAERINYTAYAILADGVTACPFATERVPAAKR